MTNDQRTRVCASGKCGYTLPAWSDGISNFPERVQPPNTVTGSDLVCDNCVIDKLGLTATYFSDDAIGLTEIVAEDDVQDVFDRLGYAISTDAIAGGYDIEDTLSITRYCLLADVVDAVRDEDTTL